MTDRKTIWVTGVNGQLGNELRIIAPTYTDLKFIFTTRSEIDIENIGDVESFLSTNSIDICINAAAYTAVDLAEKERDVAMRANGLAVGDLAAQCRLHHIKFLHVSTDYVFNGQAEIPYKEQDTTDPVNYYGETKLKGEELALENNEDCLIVRTSWVYSRFGKNFVKTMMRLMKEKESIGVVSDQFGSPTYAADLAKALVHLAINSSAPGVYHYCNEGIISWFDFASAIGTLTRSSCEVKPINTSQYPTPAKRPAYSALDTSKFKAETGLDIPDWQSSLEECIRLLSK